MGIGGAYDVDVCRLCWLTSMTSQEVRWADHDEQDPLESGGWRDLRFHPGMVDEGNSTENTAATSTHTPVNASDFSAWRGAGIGTDDARNVIWNDVDTAFLVRGAA